MHAEVTQPSLTGTEAAAGCRGEAGGEAGWGEGSDLLGRSCVPRLHPYRSGCGLGRTVNSRPLLWAAWDWPVPPSLVPESLWERAKGRMEEGAG